MFVSAPAPATELDMRQLRHHTKNALCRILAQITQTLPSTPASQRLSAEVENRVLLTAQISDALFGLTRSPGPLNERLRSLCEGEIALMSDRDQSLRLTCCVTGDVPERQHELLLRVAHEFVGNAVKHGMHMRLLGRVAVSVTSDAAGTVLRVEDDGWGWIAAGTDGEGLSLVRALVAGDGGRATLARAGDRTVAELYLPPH